MVTDPETLKTVAEFAEIGAGVIAGVEFLPTVVGCAKKWISAKFHGHPQKAIDAALSNFNDFSGQVNICLGGMQQIEGFEKKKEQTLADPDYTSLFQEAVLGAARTNSVQTHKILARLVTERLAAEPNSLRTLASHMGCNAVPQLSPKHLRFLGFMAILWAMDTPDYVKALSGETGVDSDQKTFEKGLRWLSDELSPLLPIGEMTENDYSHLAAVSCIAYGHYITTLENLLNWKFSTKHVNQSWIEQDPNCKVLCNYWISEGSLTPAGTL
jgi:hypothetical protein